MISNPEKIVMGSVHYGKQLICPRKATIPSGWEETENDLTMTYEQLERFYVESLQTIDQQIDQLLVAREAIEIVRKERDDLKKARRKQEIKILSLESLKREENTELEKDSPFSDCVRREVTNKIDKLEEKLKARSLSIHRLNSEVDDLRRIVAEKKKIQSANVNDIEELEDRNKNQKELIVELKEQNARVAKEFNEYRNGVRAGLESLRDQYL
jgi:chromosome segregation ATPase